jgi:16S rRNA (guanine966-N2)-methyltransferase
VRVVGGYLGGRRLLTVPGKDTRPTSDRVREALFATLGERVEGARVLDLFAGTGALGIEAVSRGAASAVLVEQAAPAVAVIRANLEALDLHDRVKVRRTRAETYVRAQRDGPFDLVLLDPPYATPVGLVAGLLGRLARTALAPGAVVVVEAAARAEAPPWPPGLVPAPPRRHSATAQHLATYQAPEDRR